MENKILFNYNNHFVVQNNIGDIEVINELGDKFYIRLDDSKTNGNRKMVEMDFEQQLKSSIEYIDWVTLTKKKKN
jgi:hypothetical protein